ncbi:hypothetical protein BIT28_26740 [Photobacterium proteolyticum]|uniref:Uncharacterized protein n=1 Tax=Photobacterium proteolyticum TaxID=1903952 RepID=A0A1Q9H1U1_9GAMM|nr:hypothetical protein [Photobacterium proteolyticum]OLQ81687.1 hypothetical protein BIT28_26740 [Photobacterium proteolyticum]
MLNRFLLLALCLLSFSAHSELTEEMKYGSVLLQINVAKFEEKQTECMSRVRDYRLPVEEREVLKKLDTSISKGLYFLYKKSFDDCTQPELFELSQTLLQLQELNKKENNKIINEQIRLIRQLVFTGSDISNQRFYDSLSEFEKEILESIPSFKKPFDSLQVLDVIQSFSQAE